MAICRSPMTGCCVGSNYYNLGAAHGHPRAKDVYQFAEWMRAVGVNNACVALTNPSQNVERQYLKELGFKSIGTGRIHCHFATGDEIRKSKPFIEVDRRIREVAEKKRLARLEQQKKLNERRLEKRAYTPITKTDFHRCVIRYGGNASPNRVVAQEWGLDIKFYTAAMGRFHSIGDFTGIVNRELARRAKLDKKQAELDRGA